jgi:NADH-ubiquinone oxidoreductase chain 5
MEGPTPVSALIHAATMVTAGIVLLIRSSYFLDHATNILPVIAIISVMTIFFAGTVGVFQNDIKKIIAFSTCSQLGYMMLSCALSAYDLSLFHLFNHAFFKALLFLGAGSVIHALHDEQDVRAMGGMYSLIPVTYVSMLIASLSLMGLPFLSGFYSKDLILELSFNNYIISGIFIYLVATASVALTAFYSLRLLYHVF